MWVWWIVDMLIHLIDLRYLFIFYLFISILFLRKMNIFPHFTLDILLFSGDILHAFPVYTNWIISIPTIFAMVYG